MTAISISHINIKCNQLHLILFLQEIFLLTKERHGEAPAFLRWFDNEVVTMLEKTRRRMKSSMQEPLDIDLGDAGDAGAPENPPPADKPRP